MAKKKKSASRPSTGGKTAKVKAKASKSTKAGKSARSSASAAKRSPTSAAAKKTKKAAGAKSSPRTTASKPKAKATPARAAKPAATSSPRARTAAKASPAPAVMPWQMGGGNNGDFSPLPVEQLKKVKSGLHAKDLAYFRQLLMEKRAEILGDVKSMNDVRQASGGDLSHMPVHMADIGSDNYEQEFTLGLVESEARLLREIDEAIIRLREGYYGVCVVSGKPIVRARLEAKPWAKYSIEIAREMEKRGLR